MLTARLITRIAAANTLRTRPLVRLATLRRTLATSTGPDQITSNINHDKVAKNQPNPSVTPPATQSNQQTDPDHQSKNASTTSESAKQAQQRETESSNQRHAAAQSHAYVVAAELTDNFMRALHLSEQTRFVKGLVLGLSVLGIAGLFVWINRDNVKTSTAEQVADVAKRSLNSVEIQDQVNLLSQEVVHRLLTDPAVLNTALQFTTRLLHEPSTQTALSSLVGATLRHPDTLAQAKEFSTQLVQSLSASPDVQATVADLVKQAINQPSNQQALIDLMRSVLNDPESKALLASTGSSSAHDVFNDAAVLSRATEFMKSVLADPAMQQQASDALWGAVRMTFKPKSIWGGGHIHPPHAMPSTIPSNPVTPAVVVTPAVATPSTVDATSVPVKDVALAPSEPTEPVLTTTAMPEIPETVVALRMVASTDDSADQLEPSTNSSNERDTSSNEPVIIVSSDVMSAINEKIAMNEGSSSFPSTSSSFAPTFHIVVSPVQTQQLANV